MLNEFLFNISSLGNEMIFDLDSFTPSEFFISLIIPGYNNISPPGF
jgi:hypothetical protein